MHNTRGGRPHGRRARPQRRRRRLAVGSAGAARTGPPTKPTRACESGRADAPASKALLFQGGSPTVRRAGPRKFLPCLATGAATAAGTTHSAYSSGVAQLGITNSGGTPLRCAAGVPLPFASQADAWVHAVRPLDRGAGPLVGGQWRVVQSAACRGPLCRWPSGTTGLPSIRARPVEAGGSASTRLPRVGPGRGGACR